MNTITLHQSHQTFEDIKHVDGDGLESNLSKRSTELAAKLFRATQAEEKLKRDNIKGKANANQTHHEVGKKIRQTIKELGGEMPENLPSPEKSVQSIEKKQAKLEKK
jgi:DNA-damage-inducible protein D